MSIPAAYIGVIVIWATTPLAIKWSSNSLGIYDAVLLRMLVAAPAALLLLKILRLPLRWKQAWRSYAAGAFGIYGGLLPTYYAVQYIPSGLISVLYGLAPVVSSLMAARWLDEQRLTVARLGALLIAVAGLALVFNGELAPGADGVRGLLATLLGVVLFTSSGVVIKREALALHPLAQTTGTLLLALPLFALTWACKDGTVPDVISPQALAASAYLALVSSVLSFVMYFYILTRLPLSRVALTTLASPVLALLLGVWLADEHIAPKAAAGCALILFALALYHYESRLATGVVRWLRAQG